MQSDRRDEVGGDAPSRFDVDDLHFEYSAGATPGGCQVWAVWLDVDGQVVRAEAPTASQACDRALDLAMEVRRSKAAGND